MIDAAPVESPLDLLRLLGVALGRTQKFPRVDLHGVAGLGDLGSILAEIEALRSIGSQRRERRF